MKGFMIDIESSWATLLSRTMLTPVLRERTEAMGIVVATMARRFMGPTLCVRNVTAAFDVTTTELLRVTRSVVPVLTVCPLVMPPPLPLPIRWLSTQGSTRTVSLRAWHNPPRRLRQERLPWTAILEIPNSLVSRVMETELPRRSSVRTWPRCLGRSKTALLLDPPTRAKPNCPAT